MLGPSLLAGAACSQNVHKPPPPDMQALIEAYSHPTADLTADNIGDVYDALTGSFDWFQAVCGWDNDFLTRTCSQDEPCRVCQGLDPMSRAFTTMSDQNDADARQLSRTIRGIQGYMKVERICPGYGKEPTHDHANGRALLTIGFSSKGIDPTIGGRFFSCETRVNDVPVKLIGDLSLAFERSFFLDQLEDLEPIVRFRGSITQPGEEPQFFDLNLRISLVQGTNVAVSFEVPEQGSMVFFEGAAGRGIQAANGRFSCTFDGPASQPMACRNLETGEQIP